MSAAVKYCLVVALVGIVSFCHANPYESVYQLALDELRIDGDLALRKPLCRLRLDEETTIEIYVVHNIVVGPYGRFRSVLTLRPLLTSIAPFTDKQIVWRKPGGGRLVLDLQMVGTESNEVSSEPEIDGMLLSRTEHTRYRSGAVTALVGLNVDWVLVHDGGWWLYYRQGQLCAFQTPAGGRFDVACEGGVIVSIGKNGEEYLSLKKVDGARYMLSVAKEKYVVAMNERGEVVGIEGNHCRFLVDYGCDRLVRSIEDCGIVHRYGWAKVKRSMPAELDWVKPVCLEHVDDTCFIYENRGAVVTLKKKTPNAPEKLLRVRYRYGSVISVEEKMR